MIPFTYYNPTKLIFGKGQIKELASNLKVFGNKVLLVYGGGSVVKSGLYDKITNIFKENQIEWKELAGVEPNPRVSTARKGIKLCRANNIEIILAVGGGSVIDCTKLISAGVKYDGDPWDIVLGKHVPTEALPFGTILTLAATGSEMNSGSVITNWDTKEKYGWGSPLVYPKFSILDPVNTFTVPLNQTVYGVVDIMAHVFEQYFHNVENTEVQDGFCETILKTVIDTAPKLINDLNCYEARETVLFSGTLALNRILSMGIIGDWATHNIEHAVSAVHDIPHGGGLAIIFPKWMKHVKNKNVSKFKRFAINVFNVDTNGKTDDEIALEGIHKLEEFFRSIGAPSRLADYEIYEDSIEILAEKAMARGSIGQFQKLSMEDVKIILKSCL
ncbi:MAG: NADH-dependent alcohol dehydrogenase [Bacillales bacterium]|jgi:alcohol dehydrogenase YqhD (iron-dependent ADH family)|nr:NADH-dependent alcohol dehydrogenase [Bacillales bacterium]